MIIESFYTEEILPQHKKATYIGDGLYVLSDDLFESRIELFACDGIKKSKSLWLSLDEWVNLVKFVEKETIFGKSKINAQ